MDDRDAQALQLLGEEPEAQAHDARRPAEQWLNQERGTIASLPADRILGPDGLGVPPLSGELLGPACSHDPAPGRGLEIGRASCRERGGSRCGLERAKKKRRTQAAREARDMTESEDQQ